MATINASVATILDHAKRLAPDGSVAAIAELLSQDNTLFADMLWKEGNLPTGMRSTLRTALPSGGWRKYNEGVVPSKSRTGQTEDATALLEQWAQTDKKVAELNGNTAAFRLSESMAFLESMKQEAIGTMIYGNSGTAPEEFDGFAVRYASTSGTNGQNVISGGGAGSDNCSIYLVGWGENCHGIFPKNSTAGLVHKDHGEVVVQNAGGVTGALMAAYMDQYTLEMGLHIRDWRSVVRIPNIDASALRAEASDADLTKLMTKALYCVEGVVQASRWRFYVPRFVAAFLDLQRQERVQVGGQLGYDVVDGRRINNFRGVPITICDQLLENEATVA